MKDKRKKRVRVNEEMFQDRCGPLGGSAQRRASRSPRCQRSRSADVDRLRKYTERRIEERRHTDAVAGSTGSTGSAEFFKMNPLSLQSLSQSSSPFLNSTKKFHLRRRCTSPAVKKQSNDVSEQSNSKSSTSRSHSTEGVSVNFFNKAKQSKRNDDRRRRHTADSCDRTMMRQLLAMSWMPGIIQSSNQQPVAEKKCDDVTGDREEGVAVSADSGPGPPRWMIFHKNPSPYPITRRNSERKCRVPDNEFKIRETKIVSSVGTGNWSGERSTDSVNKWQPARKFASPRAARKFDKDVSNDRKKSQDSPKGHIEVEGKREPAAKINSGTTTKDGKSSNDRSQRLSQRMRDLYDFKTENEWPQQRNLCNPGRIGNTWISKSSSEEEKPHQLQRDPSNRVEGEGIPYERTERRNSQDLEFNDRFGGGPRGVEKDHVKTCWRRRQRNADDEKDEKVTDQQQKQGSDVSRPDKDNKSGDVFDPPGRKPEHINPKSRAVKSYEDPTETKGTSPYRQRRTFSDDRDIKDAKFNNLTNTEKRALPDRDVRDGKFSNLTNTEKRALPPRRETEKVDSASAIGAKPRSSYVEIDLKDTSGVKRNSRTSDVSYASISSSNRASLDYKTSAKISDLPARRAFSQGEEMPVPPTPRKVRMLSATRTTTAAPTNLLVESFDHSEDTNSTRYKVYLT